MVKVFREIDCVLFDMDGTLVETDIDFALMKREIIAFAESRGLLASQVQGLDILAIVDALVDHIGVSEGNSEAALTRIGAFELLEGIEFEPCSRARQVDHARELLDALRSAGIRVGIVTRNCRKAVTSAMERTGISAEVVITRDDVVRTKPHPDHLLYALGLLGVGADRSMIVGDHPMDIQGGKAAGMRTVGFLRRSRPDDFFDEVKPDFVIRDLRELLTDAER